MGAEGFPFNPDQVGEITRWGIAGAAAYHSAETLPENQVPLAAVRQELNSGQTLNTEVVLPAVRAVVDNTADTWRQNPQVIIEPAEEIGQVVSSSAEVSWRVYEITVAVAKFAKPVSNFLRRIPIGFIKNAFTKVYELSDQILQFNAKYKERTRDTLRAVSENAKRDVLVRTTGRIIAVGPELQDGVAAFETYNKFVVPAYKPLREAWGRLKNAWANAPRIRWFGSQDDDTD